MVQEKEVFGDDPAKNDCLSVGTAGVWEFPESGPQKIATPHNSYFLIQSNLKMFRLLQDCFKK